MSDSTHLERTHGKIQLLLVILAFAGLQLLLTLYLRMDSPVLSEPEPEKIESLNPKLFEVMSFGQLPAVIDWMWLKTLQDPFVAHVKRGNHPAIFYTLDLITQLDPAYFESYIAGATLVSVIRDDGAGALQLLLRGEEFREKELNRFEPQFRERYWSSEWQLPLLMAYVYLFDLDDMPHAELAYRKASGIPGSPPYLQVLVEQFGKKGGAYHVGLRLLDLMIRSNDKDPGLREKLVVRRESLKVNYFLYDINERFQGFLDRNRVSKEYRGVKDHLKKYWEEFSGSQEEAIADPWGGKLSLGENGKIVTSTEHKKVFGLE